MNRYHVVGITTRGYHRLASYDTFEFARQDAINRSMWSMGVVLRDGTNGKRYCVAELKRLA